MDTDEVITMLSRGPDTRVAAPSFGRLARTVLLPLALALAVSGGLMAGLLGVRPDLASALLSSSFWVKIGFLTLLASGGCLVFRRLAVPGVDMGAALRFVLLPLLVIWIASSSMLINADADARAPLFFGQSWRVCPLLIALLSAPLLVAMLAIMRQAAPTRLGLAGAASGLTAGAIAAIVYCLHCPEVALPFIAFWYVLGIAIPTAIGALIGPRMLRW